MNPTSAGRACTSCSGCRRWSSGSSRCRCSACSPATRRSAFLDYLGILLWLMGFVFEAGGDWQLSRFRRNPANAGAVLNRGFWRYTRHPNYFGSLCVWWGFWCMAASAGAWWSAVGPALLTLLLLRGFRRWTPARDSGNRRPQYADYVLKTNAFFPGPSTEIDLKRALLWADNAGREPESAPGNSRKPVIEVDSAQREARAREMRHDSRGAAHRGHASHIPDPVCSAVARRRWRWPGIPRCRATRRFLFTLILGGDVVPAGDAVRARRALRLVGAPLHGVVPDRLVHGVHVAARGPYRSAVPHVRVAGVPRVLPRLARARDRDLAAIAYPMLRIAMLPDSYVIGASAWWRVFDQGIWVVCEFCILLLAIRESQKRSRNSPGMPPR